MSIASEITRLQNIKTSIRSALVTQGVPAASGHDMADFSADILSISTGGGATITVTYSSQFYNKTMTCTKGTKTYTKTTTSSGSTTFSVAESGTWTITCNGVSRTVDVVLEYSTQMAITKTITVYSAASDTVSFTDVTGAKTVTTNTSGQGSVSITFIPPSASITFTSSKAKNPNNLSQAYSKTVTISTNTTAIYVMPDTTLYWYGNNIANISGEAYSFNTGNPAKAPTITFNTNSATISLTGAGNRGIAMSSQTYDLSNFSSMKSVSAITASTYSGYSLAYFDSTETKATPYTYHTQILNNGGGTRTEQLFTKDMSALSTAMYCGFSFLSSGSVSTNGTVTLELKALWLE